MDMDKHVDYRAMGVRVLLRRRELKITQEQLAERVGVSCSFIGHIERAEKKPSVETVVALCDSLDITADYLLRGQKVRCDQQQCYLYTDIKALLFSLRRMKNRLFRRQNGAKQAVLPAKRAVYSLPATCAARAALL